MTHLAPQHGFDSYTGYEVGPDDMKHLEDQQQEVEEPPGRVRPNYGPALKHSGVQDPGKDKEMWGDVFTGTNEDDYVSTDCNCHLDANRNQAGE